MAANALKRLVRLFCSELFRDLEAALECIGATYVDQTMRKQGARRSSSCSCRSCAPDLP